MAIKTFEHKKTKIRVTCNYAEKEVRWYSRPFGALSIESWIVEDSGDWEEVLPKKLVGKSLDDEDLFVNDHIFCINEKWQIGPWMISPYLVDNYNEKFIASRRLFKNEDKAKEFVKIHKPKHSNYDIEKVLQTMDLFQHDIVHIMTLLNVQQ